MATPHDSTLLTNKKLGPYQIEEVLGSGGVAIVYAVYDQHQQLIALKILNPAFIRQADIRNLFQQEYKTLARLTHPGIVRVYDFGTLQGNIYIAQELVHGETLEEFLKRTKRIGEAAAIDITQQLADILGYLHEQQLVYRDLKPANIMLTQRRRPKLIDFGTVLQMDDAVQMAGQAGSLYGTPAYGSPEVIRGKTDIDGRSDLYSLGVLLYRMVTGQKPYYGSREDVLRGHVAEEAAPPSQITYVSPGLEAVILHAMAKDPNDRFQSGAEFIKALGELEPAPEKPDLSQRIRGWFRAPAAA